MTTSGTGLGDKQRTWIGIGIGVFLTVITAILALPDDQRPPAFVVTVLSIAMAALIAFDRLAGIRDATSAAVAKEVDPDSTNTRDTSDSVK